MRPRFENIDDDLESSDRNRNRLRARLTIAATLDDNWSAALGLASGGTNPISTNQTLGGGAFTKDLRLDLAYVTYAGFANTALTAGKYRNVFFKPGGQNLIFGPTGMIEQTPDAGVHLPNTRDVEIREVARIHRRERDGPLSETLQLT